MRPFERRTSLVRSIVSFRLVLIHAERTRFGCGKSDKRKIKVYRRRDFQRALFYAWLGGSYNQRANSYFVERKRLALCAVSNSVNKTNIYMVATTNKKTIPTMLCAVRERVCVPDPLLSSEMPMLRRRCDSAADDDDHQFYYSD